MGLAFDEAFPHLPAATAVPGASGDEMKHADEPLAAQRLIRVFVHQSTPFLEGFLFWLLSGEHVLRA